MPKRIALAAIGLTRDGKTVYPEIGTATTGTPFDFTADELTEITALEKASGNVLIRKLNNEGAVDVGDDNADKALADMTVKELQAEAAKREIDLGAAKTKAEILAVIEAAGEDL